VENFLELAHSIVILRLGTDDNFSGELVLAAELTGGRQDRKG